ncbi:hypothetical protein C4573_06720 [Candidatus Woesearchaeota archaeon]|nr:MAG: hypothetical protein C4573_06720 [Candidatus Woesearchaeota archaeon]
MMMKKMLVLFFVLLISLSMVHAKSMAVQEIRPLPAIPSVAQYYSVYFDEEGEAIVTLSVNLVNNGDETINQLTVEIPSAQVRFLGVMQRVDDVQYDAYGNFQTIGYESLEVTPTELSHSLVLPLTLKDSVQAKETTNMLIVYKANGYVKTSAGVHNFNFETAKFPYDTSTVRVAVNVQEGLYLKGTRSNVNYLPNTMLMAKSTMDMTAAERQTVNNYASQIMYASGWVKTASYLDPLESFSVEGKYANSWFTVNWAWLLFILVIIVLVIFGIVFLVKKLKKNAPAKIITTKNTPEKKSQFLLAAGAGFFNALAIAIIWIIVVVIANSMGRYGSIEIVGLFLILLAILITLGLLIGVPLYLGSKYGFAVGGGTALTTFAWLFIFAIILVVILFLTMTTRTVY